MRPLHAEDAGLRHAEAGAHGTDPGAYTVYTSRAKQVRPAKKNFFFDVAGPERPAVHTVDASVSSFAVGCVPEGHKRELFRGRLCTRGTRA
jgi:hypothetical protein